MSTDQIMLAAIRKKLGLPESCAARRILCAIDDLQGKVGGARDEIQVVDGRWYWVRYEGLGQTYEAPAMFKANAHCFYSYQFTGIPLREVMVLREA